MIVWIVFQGSLVKEIVSQWDFPVKINTFQTAQQLHGALHTAYYPTLFF